MNIVAIVQARMGSSRLPGKVVKEVLGKPLLEIQIERLKRSAYISQIIVATTDRESEQPIIEICNRLSVPVFRGSENDVLSRYYGAAKETEADHIIRLTSDCPVIDPVVIDRVIDYYLSHHYDYVSNSITRTYPRGMDTEVFSFKVLEEAESKALLDFEREHVTPYIYQDPTKYKVGQVCNHSNESRHRWTVDTVEDFLLIKLMIETLYPSNQQFNLEDMLELFKKNPDWAKINENVEQKKLGE